MSDEGIKVTDRRMFTPDGELREEYRHLAEGAKAREPETRRPEERREAAEVAEAASRPEDLRARGAESPLGGGPAPGQPDPNAQRPPVEIPDTGPAGSLGEGPGFFDLVGVLAEPVPFYLGDARLPTGESGENLEAARFHIDLLDLLRQKTVGNLDAQEANALEDLLYRLRVRYVQKRG